MKLQVSVNMENISVAFVGQNHCTKITTYCISQLAVGFLEYYLSYQWRKSRLSLYATHYRFGYIRLLHGARVYKCLHVISNSSEFSR